MSAIAIFRQSDRSSIRQWGEKPLLAKRFFQQIPITKHVNAGMIAAIAIPMWSETLEGWCHGCLSCRHTCMPSE